LGTRAHALKLVDEIRTSDDYLMSLRDTTDIFEVEYSIKKKMFDRLSGLIGRLRGDNLLTQNSQSMTRLT
jgi:serine protease SohB